MTVHISKGFLLGKLLQISFFLATIILASMGGMKFFLITLVFILLGGTFEFIIMNNFYCKTKKIILRDDPVSIKIKNAFLWVHKNIDFIKNYNATIYRIERVGIMISTLSYAIIFLYVAVALFFYKLFNYYGILIYLIPVFSNSKSFFKNNYLISSHFEK